MLVYKYGFMQQLARLAFRGTRVTTVVGLSIGWLHDVVLDLDSGKVETIQVVASRFWRICPVSIPSAQIVRWIPGHIVVKDAWSMRSQESAESVRLPAPVPSCYAKRT